MFHQCLKILIDELAILSPMVPKVFSQSKSDRGGDDPNQPRRPAKCKKWVQANVCLMN